MSNSNDPAPNGASKPTFTIGTTTPSDATDELCPRLGTLQLPGRRTVETPNFTAVTSRGVIPHLTPEVVSKYTSFSSAYISLEDFLEKKDHAILKMPTTDRPLHAFTSFPTHIPTIVAARRCPSVLAPGGNTAKNISIFTSTGFSTITVPKFAATVAHIRPDIVIPLADLLHISLNPSLKKKVRMADRTESWMDEFLELVNADVRESAGIKVFAPILPIDHATQWAYINHLNEDLSGDLAGLAIYDVNILPDLQLYKNLTSLPKLSLDLPKTPHDVLRQVALGVDLVLASFVNVISDAGIAFSFTLPTDGDIPTDGDAGAIRPLGVDMSETAHATSLEPLLADCVCYTCTKHHRAYVNHLLHAKEMLGWNLLQIHNHHVLSVFFSSIRTAMGRGTFEAAREAFGRAWDVDFPQGMGERPRARGYHFKSEVSQEKYNKPVWKGLEPGQGVMADV
ncbi:Queuine tRNA-ribosyltransferase-like protein [Emericellopsis cladophorae]|uniref:Queuine tRNA-ribosyltransferase accessory subunit 2 n=1 Tax=Emericellopsis cladophorae TaxID=2686198 RepID=A0A9P9Y3E3_9HYPO|nr:Queuine tRNA-ribosyltransferase-like protein [Emericellopsis cladophorae]KAI6782893.1 Queuine tRNA-ribosyltransferase-like protein [Emericellopsis cladophorae]